MFRRFPNSADLQNVRVRWDAGCARPGGQIPAALCPSEASAAAVSPGAATAFAALVTGHLLRDGELVVLILRPSRWFILLSSLRFLAVVAIFMAASVILGERWGIPSRQYVECGAIIMAARLMWAVLHWMGRLYILTDLRLLRLSGVFNVDIFDCPLRKVARTMLEVTFKERLCRVGTIIIIPQDEDYPIGAWQMVPRPKRIHQQIMATIARAKQGGVGSIG